MDLKGSLIVIDKDLSVKRLFKLKNLFTIVILWSAFFAIIWFADFEFDLFIVAAISFVISVFSFLLLSFLFYIYGNKKIKKIESLSNKDKRLNIKFAKRFAHFIKLQRKTKHHKSYYDESIYLFLTLNIGKDARLLSQMGYELFLSLGEDNEGDYPIQCWLSPHSIIVTVEASESLNRSHIVNLCKCLNRHRKRRAVNGLIVATEIDFIIGHYSDLNSYTDKMRSIIHQCNSAFGLNIPIYNVFTELSSIDDLCTFFSTCDKNVRDEPFGALMPNVQNDIDFNWFDESFDDLTSKLVDALARLFDRQLTESLRQSVAAAPFQFSLIKPYVAAFFKQLYQNDNYHELLKFRGYFFTNSTENPNTRDLLADLTVKKLNSNKYFQLRDNDFCQPLFIQGLMSQVILSENKLVGVNHRRENVFIFGQIIYGVFWGAIWLSTLTVLKMSFDFQNQRELQADKMLKKYKASILTSPYEIQHLSKNVPNLSTLYNIDKIYSENEPWYALSVIPNSNIKHSVENAYQNTLTQVLQPSMVYDLEQDLFIYKVLNDKNKALSLLNVYHMIETNKSDQADVKSVNEYFINELVVGGQNDKGTLVNFANLVSDASTLPIKHSLFDPNLLQVSKDEVSTGGIENLLYRQIKKIPTLSRTIDLRDEFGSKFDQVFTFKKGFDGYFVPFMFTPQGFNELDLSISSPIIKRSLDAYISVVGMAPSSVEFYRITKELNRRYQQDYVNFWKDLIQNVEIKPINSTVQLRQMLDLLSSASDNPLTIFYQQLAKYTQLNIPTENSAGLTKLKALTSKKLSAGVDSLVAESSQKTLLAKNISNIFKEYDELTQVDDKGVTPLNQIQEHIKASKIWLDNFYLNSNPQVQAFSILSQALPRNNPVSTLYYYATQQTGLVKDVLQFITQFIDKRFISLTHSYLNGHWNNYVYRPFKKNIASFYPFNTQSKDDVAATDLRDFFGVNGALNQFTTEKLASFRHEVSHRPYLPGLLPDSKLVLKSSLWKAVAYGKEIQNTLNIKKSEPLAINFQLKAAEMDTAILDFIISGNKPIFTYQHGPSVWVAETWVIDAVRDDQLSLKVGFIDESPIIERYNGAWNWHRMLAPKISWTNSRYSDVLFEFDGKWVKLLLQTKTKANLFKPEFFSDFTLPSSI